MNSKTSSIKSRETEPSASGKTGAVQGAASHDADSLGLMARNLHITLPRLGQRLHICGADNAVDLRPGTNKADVFLFLPPYSPDLNPIEMAFSKLKALIRQAAARTYDDPWRVVGNVCDLFTEEECCNFFKAAGYQTN